MRTGTILVPWIQAQSLVPSIRERCLIRAEARDKKRETLIPSAPSIFLYYLGESHRQMCLTVLMGVNRDAPLQLHPSFQAHPPPQKASLTALRLPTRTASSKASQAMWL